MVGSIGSGSRVVAGVAGVGIDAGAGGVSLDLLLEVAEDGSGNGQERG